ncbi:M23 family metallopeptidase [Cupriavidus taiwanensis]|uniref:Uncharacterized protein n=1 Tax=Cupriavidus taiwanensis TaxID=164546 RepID=A0A375JDD8_9BURK|nr:M23 family metallopeptidase [Cupriavidus taiwanensis]SPS01586.1 Conserved hypothetical protein; putative chitinase [Cupriavidus taiwanensis]
MLISPPFLPPRADNQTEEQWLEVAMSGGEPGDGSYPVSYNLGWHGGMHLQAPVRGNAGMEPVRAIADGVVVYRRGTSEPPGAPAPDSPLSYGGRTSDGVVVIRHETEIGAASQRNTPTRVVFFSVYMHLHTVRSAVRQGRPIYRKGELGQAGYIRGKPGQIHFEIICDDVNLRKLVGRSSGLVSHAGNGRCDAVFGELYFHLAESVRVYAQRPPLNRPASLDGAMLGEDLFVGLRYAEGDGTPFTRGHAYVTTYRQTGTPLGASLVEPDAEYNLYRDANDISEAYPANARPVPSAVYELLRFGRIVGPDSLVPADVPHWRRIRTPSGTGWVNLNAQGVHKFSDADFPQWRGWQLIEEAEDGNCLCNAPEILRRVDFNRDGSISADEAHTRLVAPEVKAFLKRLICKFPTEWDATTIDSCWGWLTTRSSVNSKPMTDTQFDRLRAHNRALAFWKDANLQVPRHDLEGKITGHGALPSEHWHFDPREFIRIFRKCKWLSPLEFSLIYTDTYQQKVGSRLETARNALSHEARERYRIQINQIARKYHVSGSSYRLSHFLGQGAEESRTLTLMFERRSEASCNQLYSGRLGNDLPGDAFRYRGRGMKQLTGKYNYTEYWVYRGWIIRESFDRSWWERRGVVRRPVISNPDVLGADTYAVIDAGGWYWAASPHRGEPHMLSSINRMISSSRPTRENVRVVTRAINGGEAGLDNREFHTDRIYRVVGDEVYQ